MKLDKKLRSPMLHVGVKGFNVVLTKKKKKKKQIKTGKHWQREWSIN